MKMGKNIVWVILLSLCIQLVAVADTGKAAQETISITEFYNNGTFGSGYEKALAGAVVTISNAEEMKTFFHCLDNKEWTDGISFRQEADISFSDTTFSYDGENEAIEVREGDTLLGVADRKGEFFLNYPGGIPTTLQKMGLSDACFERESQVFSGEYDGQGHFVNGIIIEGPDQMHNGIFGYLSRNAIVSDIKVKNGLLLDACGFITGLSEGKIRDCSIESVVGIGRYCGAIGDSSRGTMLRCRLNHGTFLNSEKMYSLEIKMGGLVASVYDGLVSDCSVEGLQIYTSDSINTRVGGITGYQSGGELKNCTALGNISIPQKGKNYIAGGITGYIECQFQTLVNNCISAGKITGGITGGVVGACSVYEEDGTMKDIGIENNVSFTTVTGNVAGALAGEMEEGDLRNCYYYDQMTDCQAVGRIISGTQSNCYLLNYAQIYGKSYASVIDPGSIYGNTPSLLTALNNWVRKQSSYLEWKAGTRGYPVLMSESAGAPEGDYDLGDIPEEVPVETEPPSGTKVPVETETPSGTKVPVETESPSGTETPESPEPTAPGVPPSSEPVNENQLDIKDLKINLTDSLKVDLRWTASKNADGYQVFRSVKKASGFKKKADISPETLSYRDRKAKPGKRYYYLVRAYKKENETTLYGAGIKKKIQVMWYRAPVIRLSKGKTSSRKSYVQISIRRYSGKRVEVYFKTGKERYIKAPLKTDRISYYHGKLRFSYKRKAVLYCKIRTYQIKKGKKRFSVFSKEKKIRL